MVLSAVQPCSSSPISLRRGSAESVVLPVPESPKNIAVSSFAPVLAEHCVGCHGGNRPQARLGLDTFANLLAGNRAYQEIVRSQPMQVIAG